MSKLLTQSDHDIDASDGGTIETGLLSSNAGSSNELSSASVAGQKVWLARLPWSHLSVLSVILITGLKRLQLPTAQMLRLKDLALAPDF